MPKHVCTSEPLSQHVSINTMNNTYENVWLSSKKRLKYFAQIKSFSYHITLSCPFLRVNRVRGLWEPHQKSAQMGRGGDRPFPDVPLARAAIPKGDRIQAGFLETHLRPHTPTTVASPVPQPPGQGPKSGRNSLRRGAREDDEKAGPRRVLTKEGLAGVE